MSTEGLPALQFELLVLSLEPFGSMSHEDVNALASACFSRTLGRVCDQLRRCTF